MADAWRKYKHAIAEKRTGKKKAPSNDILKKEEIVIQRLSAEVSGKAQKYSRIGPREFVPYKYDEVTISNIKEACTKHFSTTVGNNMTCDILASEQGPSCTSLDHIPDLRVVHIRFIETQGTSLMEVQRPAKRRCVNKATEATKSLPCDQPPSPSRVCPKSLSVIEMLKLGKVVNEKSPSEVIDLFSFDINEMVWSRKPTTVEFLIDKEPIGEGGFREAFKATSKPQGFQGRDWVLKKYLQSAENTIAETNQTVEQHTMKVVQMHTLAKNFASQLKKELEKEKIADLYGPTLHLKKIFMGRMEGEKWVTVEEFIEGSFTKYINNNGMVCGAATCERDKCESLAHFSYEHSNKELMVVDMQGSDHSLFDPEIASKKLSKEDEVLFSIGNLSTLAINNFVKVFMKWLRMFFKIVLIL